MPVFYFLLVLLFGFICHLAVHYVGHLIQVGTGFNALTACSGYFVSHRPLSEILSHELAGIASLVAEIQIDTKNKSVTAFGISKNLAEYFGLPIKSSYFVDEFQGCKLGKPDDSKLKDHIPSTDSSNFMVTIHPELQNFVDSQFTQESFLVNQTRALLVVHKNRIVAEAYQDKFLKLKSTSRLLGWSMSKAVHSLIVGAAIQDGLLSLHSPARLPDLPPAFRDHLVSHHNKGLNVTIADLMTMADILPFPEDYSIGADVSSMLYDSIDYAKHAAESTKPDHERGLSKSKQFVRNLLREKRYAGQTRPLSPAPALHPPLYDRYSFSNHTIESPSSSHLHPALSPHLGWYYSSAVSNLLAKELRTLFPSSEEYISYPTRRFFNRLGARDRPIFQTDPSGVFAASSFVYASARDWARMGLLLMEGGLAPQVEGRERDRILSESFVKFVLSPRPGSAGLYGGSFWLNSLSVSQEEYEYLPSTHQDKKRRTWTRSTLPSDAFLFCGFDGQFVIGIPSKDLLIVRLGMTKDNPENGPEHFSPARLFGTILKFFE